MKPIFKNQYVAVDPDGNIIIESISDIYELVKIHILNNYAVVSTFDQMQDKGWRIANVDIKFTPHK